MKLPFAKAATAAGRAAPRTGGRRLFLTPFAPLVVGLLLSTCRSASASCWQDGGVMATGQAIVGQSFPELQGRMPLIVVCSGSEFGPNVGGDYNGGDHRIRIPDWQVQSGRLASVLQHEFCHAVVAVQGQDDGRAQGHGVGFMRCLLNRGLQGEAVRVAGVVPGAQEALALAGGGQGGGAGGGTDGYGPPPGYAPPVYPPAYGPPGGYVPPTYAPVQCQLVLQQRQFVGRHGQMWIALVPVRICG